MSPSHRAPGPPALGPVLPSCIHELNTLVWLAEVSGRAGRPVTLADVPGHEWDTVVLPGVDCVWLMGVWERSAVGREIALADEGNRSAWDAALPGWTEDDVVGSPYSVQQYVCAERFGGRDGLAAARTELAERGARLMVDLVPNHVAPDHPLVRMHPDAFVRGDVEDLERDPLGFVQLQAADGTRVVMARGRDPYFPPWRDVVQLDAFSPTAREFLRSTLEDIAAQADGVRCDMAMLLLDDVFGATWGERAGPPLQTPLWVEVLDALRADHPGFVVVAEAYWGREPDLTAQGFDACYDKVLYDRLVSAPPRPVRDHLTALGSANPHTVRFLENHDEPRAAATLPPRERELAASLAVATLPGATLWHEGQLDGRTVRLPVFLARRPDEAPDAELRTALTALIEVAGRLRLSDAVGGPARWELLATRGWPDNPTHDHLLSWSWATSRPDDGWSLVVVNLSDAPAQGLVDLTRPSAVAGRSWRLTDALTGSTYERAGDEVAAEGFFVDLPPWGQHALLARPITPAEGNREGSGSVSPP